MRRRGISTSLLCDTMLLHISSKTALTLFAAIWHRTLISNLLSTITHMTLSASWLLSFLPYAPLCTSDWDYSSFPCVNWYFSKMNLILSFSIHVSNRFKTLCIISLSSLMFASHLLLERFWPGLPTSPPPAQFWVQGSFSFLTLKPSPSSLATHPEG